MKRLLTLILALLMTATVFCAGGALRYAHAEGAGTIALGYCEHVSGQYNAPDAADTWTAGTSYSVGDVVIFSDRMVYWLQKTAAAGTPCPK